MVYLVVYLVVFWQKGVNIASVLDYSCQNCQHVKITENHRKVKKCQEITEKSRKVEKVSEMSAYAKGLWPM